MFSIITINLIVHNLIYIFAYHRNISSLFIFIASCIELFFLFIVLRRKKLSINGCLLSMMGSVIPTSFRNIFGGGFGDLPLNWFYIIGGIIFIYNVILLINSLENIKVSKLSIISLITMIITIVPYIRSDSIRHAFSEFLNYLFFVTMIFISSIKIFSISNEDSLFIKRTYIISVFLSAIAIISQYLLFKFTNTIFLRVQFFGSNRMYFSYMFGDMSSATVYMATSVILLLLDNRKLSSFITIFIILSAMALSSARSGLVAILICILMYVIFGKSIRDKVVLLVSLTSSLPLLVVLSRKVRVFSSRLNYFTQDSGRFNGYIEGIKFFLKNPIVGSGFDLGYKFSLSEGSVPHNALIYMLAQMGVIVSSLYLYIFFEIYRVSSRLNNEEMRYVVLLSYIGSMLIPGFIASRFFTVISMWIIGQFNYNSISGVGSRSCNSIFFMQAIGRKK